MRVFVTNSASAREVAPAVLEVRRRASLDSHPRANQRPVSLAPLLHAFAQQVVLFRRPPSPLPPRRAQRRRGANGKRRLRTTVQRRRGGDSPLSASATRSRVLRSDGFAWRYALRPHSDAHRDDGAGGRAPGHGRLLRVRRAREGNLLRTGVRLVQSPGVRLVQSLGVRGNHRRVGVAGGRVFGQ